ncbi:type IV conjugative transfer system coupling protein TraD, partial [Salmonella enterica subsp. enterica serovar Braenderup]
NVVSAGVSAESTKPAVSAPVISAAAHTAAAATEESNPVEEVDMTQNREELINQETGEIVQPGDEGYDALYEQLNQHAENAVNGLRQDERNLVVHRQYEALEVDHDREVSW